MSGTSNRIRKRKNSFVKLKGVVADRGNGGGGAPCGKEGLDNGDFGVVQSEVEFTSEDEDEHATEVLSRSKKELLEETQAAWSKWKKLMRNLNLLKVFPDIDLLAPDKATIVRDLRTAPLGKFYQNLMNEDSCYEN